jgi:hypothetical protein
MGYGVLDHEGLNAFRMRDGEPESDGAAIILHVEYVLLEIQRLGEILHHGRDAIECVGKFLRAWRIAVSETRVIGSDEVILR